VLTLLENSDELRSLLANPALIKSAVEELLRFNAPLETATERYPSEDVTISGVTIPRGELVLAVIASANRDHCQFENLDRLDLARDPNRPLAFGHGVHYRLGAPLACLEGQIAISILLRRIPDLRLAKKLGTPQWRVLRGLKRLPVAFAKRGKPNPD
jgi:cytochrome P450